jgi:hypothetical protein
MVEMVDVVVHDKARRVLGNAEEPSIAKLEGIHRRTVEVSALERFASVEEIVELSQRSSSRVLGEAAIADQQHIRRFAPGECGGEFGCVLGAIGRIDRFDFDLAVDRVEGIDQLGVGLFRGGFAEDC